MFNKKRGATSFWVSYTDLLTGLVAVFSLLVLVLIATQKSSEVIAIETKRTVDSLHLVIDTLKKNAVDQAAVTIALEEYKRMQAIYASFDNFKGNSFVYEPANQRFILTQDIIFPPDQSNISTLKSKDRTALIKAGDELYKFLATLRNTTPDVDYLIVIEGNTQRANNNWMKIPDIGYEFSYQRALGLFNFWKQHGCNLQAFNTAGKASQFEVLVTGSGYFGKYRHPKDENKNRRFVIQIAPKLGKWSRPQVVK